MADWASLGTSLGGGLVGSVLGYFGQRDANKTNREIASQTNAQNYKIWQEQQQHNIDMFNMQNQAQIDMWNMQNEYNTASAQRQRLEDAGLNPYLMMNGGNAGVATSMNAGTAQPAQAPTMQPGAPMESALGAGVQGYAQMMNALSQAYAAANESEEHISRLPGIVSDIKNKDVEYRTNKYIYDYLLPKDLRIKSVDAQVKEETAEAQVELTKTMLEGQKLDNIIKGLDSKQKEIMNEYFDQKQQVDLARDIQGLVNDVFNGLLSEKELDKKVAEITEIYAKIAYTKVQTALGSQQYEFNEEMNPLLVEGAETDISGKKEDNKLKQLEYYFRSNIVVPMIKSTVSQYELDETRNKNEKVIEDNISYGSSNPLFRNLGGFGKFFSRNIIGDIIGFKN